MESASSGSAGHEVNKVKHMGGCHCGAVRFEVWAPDTLDVIDCNCSICFMKRNVHFIVPDKDFKLLKSFYTPRSNPDGKAVTIYCLDPGTMVATTVTTYDGRNWEASMKANPSIKDRSKH